MDEKELNMIKDEIRTINFVVFGNPTTGEKGMKQKVDDIHEVMIQLRGWKSLGMIILMFGAVIAMVKGWMQ